jgi:hypothetical protein
VRHPPADEDRVAIRRHNVSTRPRTSTAAHPPASTVSKRGACAGVVQRREAGPHHGIPP